MAPQQRGKPLCGQSKDILFRLYEYFKEVTNKDKSSVTTPTQLVANSTGIPLSTVKRILLQCKRASAASSHTVLKPVSQCDESKVEFKKHQPLKPATLHTAESSCLHPEDLRQSMTSHCGHGHTGLLHPAIQCNECGLDVIGFRYKCMQCADPECDLCAACEARGAHPDHYVLRIPRPLQLAHAQVLFERVRGCFEEDSQVEHKEFKVEIEELNIDSKFIKKEDEYITVKTELMEAADISEYSKEPPDDLKPKPPALPPTPHPPPAPSECTLYRKRKPHKTAEEIKLTKLLKPCPLSAIPQAPSIIIPHPAFTNIYKEDPLESGSSTYKEFGGHWRRQP